MKPRDYLQAYLDYALKISCGELRLARAATRRFGGSRPNGSGNGVEDGFITSVGDFIRELGHEPVPSDDGDAFGLDFAIRDVRTGLFGIGIECDGPRHELLRHARAREIWRPAVLARDSERAPRRVAWLVPPAGRRTGSIAGSHPGRPFGRRRMSGPKVVRIVTREEVEAICRRHLAIVEDAAAEVRLCATRHNALSDAVIGHLDERVQQLLRLFEEDRWIELQKQAPVTVAFLKAETQRIQTEAVAAAEAARSKRRRIADAAATILAAMEASGIQPSAEFRTVSTRAHLASDANFGRWKRW